MHSAEELLHSLSRVRLVAFDVDGVLTDGRVQYLGGEELMSFDVQDGLGLKLLREAEVQLAWISGRGSVATRRRAQELGIEELHLFESAKAERLEDVQDRLDIPVEETAAIGDDLPDLGLAQRAQVFVAPRNARSEVRSRAHWVTRAAGGNGAVRELAEAILTAKGLWMDTVARYARRSD